MSDKIDMPLEYAVSHPTVEPKKNFSFVAFQFNLTSQFDIVFIFNSNEEQAVSNLVQQRVTLFF